MLPKARTPNPIDQLAERLIPALESFKAEGGGAYPPTLRRLTERVEGQPELDDVIKAAGKKSSGKTALFFIHKFKDSPPEEAEVYLKDDKPTKPVLEQREAGKLAAQLLAVLESQQRLGSESYPPTLRRLAELSGRKASDTLVPKAAAHPVLAGRALVTAEDKGKPKLDGLILFSEDIDSITPALLRSALQPVETKGKKPTVSHAFTLDEIDKRLGSRFRDRVRHSVEQGMTGHSLPPDVAWVLIKGKPHFFLMDHLQTSGERHAPSADGRQEARPEPPAILAALPLEPAPEAPGRDFAAAFAEAFERLDHQNRGSNFVKLHDLRRALPQFDREEFDAGLRQLRLAGRFSLDSHEGLSGTLTPEEREDGIREAGSLLIYVSRR